MSPEEQDTEEVDAVDMRGLVIVTGVRIPFGDMVWLFWKATFAAAIVGLAFAVVGGALWMLYISVWLGV